MKALSIIICIIGCYLLGSVPWGYLLVLWRKKIDIRKYGSGNIGFSNVLRVAGKPTSFLVLLLDIAKGWVAVAVLAPAFQAWSQGWSPEIYQISAFCAVVAGHIFTVFLSFRGGKGIATAAGALLALYPPALLTCLGIWLLLLALFRYISLASVVAVAVLPAVMILAGKPMAIIIFSFLLALVIIGRHIGNLKRLCHGKENKIGEKVRINDETRNPKPE